MTTRVLGRPSRLAQLSEGIPRPFWALLLGTFITKAGAFIMPLLFIYLTQVRKLDLPIAGAITALYGLGSLVGTLIGGGMADRFGRRFTMLLSLLVGAGFLLVLGVSRELWAIALAVFFTSMTSDAYRPASQALVADIVPTQHRMKAFGMQYWAINFGFAIAAVVGGYMARRNFGALFIADAATTLVLAFIVWKAIPESKPAPKENDKPTQGTVFTPFADRTYAPFLLLNFLVALLVFQHLSALPDDMKTKGLTTEEFGWAMATNGVLIVLLQPFALKWAERFPHARILAMAAALTGIGFGLTTFANSLPLYALSVAVWTLGEIFFAPVNAALVAAMSPTELRGRYQGAFHLTWSLASMVAPLMSSSLLPVIGHRTLWFSCLGIGLAVALAHLTWSARALPKQVAATE
ncbi:MAG: MFS transporter [Archangium sp.]|nr:MFS transporter [Archangium sp.]